MMFYNPTSEWKVHPAIIRAMDVICILHADHEQNASTSTVRIAGSSLVNTLIYFICLINLRQANPYACIASGIASLWGPAHGGANEACIDMLEEIGKLYSLLKAK